MPQRVIELLILLADGSMSCQERLESHLQCRLVGCCHADLMAKPAMLLARLDLAELDAERLERPANMSLEILAEPDQAITGGEKRAQKVARR